MAVVAVAAVGVLTAVILVTRSTQQGDQDLIALLRSNRIDVKYSTSPALLPPRNQDVGGTVTLQGVAHSISLAEAIRGDDYERDFLTGLARDASSQIDTLADSKSLRSAVSFAATAQRLLGPTNTVTSRALEHLNGLLRPVLGQASGPDVFPDLQGLSELIDSLDSDLKASLTTLTTTACASIKATVHDIVAFAGISVAYFNASAIASQLGVPCDVDASVLRAYLDQILMPPTPLPPWQKYFELPTLAIIAARLGEDTDIAASVQTFRESANGLILAELPQVADLDALAAHYISWRDAPHLADGSAAPSQQILKDMAYEQIVRLPDSDLAQRVLLLDLAADLHVSFGPEAFHPAGMSLLERWALSAYNSQVEPISVEEFKQLTPEMLSSLGFTADLVAARHATGLGGIPARCDLAVLADRHDVRQSAYLSGVVARNCNTNAHTSDFRYTPDLPVDYTSALALLDTCKGADSTTIRSRAKLLVDGITIGSKTSMDSAQLWSLFILRSLSDGQCNPL